MASLGNNCQLLLAKSHNYSNYITTHEINIIIALNLCNPLPYRPQFSDLIKQVAALGKLVNNIFWNFLDGWFKEVTLSHSDLIRQVSLYHVNPTGFSCAVICKKIYVKYFCVCVSV